MRFLTLLICILAVSSLSAQKSEVALFGGVSTYSGDLAPNTNSTILESKFAYGAYYRYSQGRFFSFRASILAGGLSATDANSDNINTQRRNLSFNSPLVELSVMPEFNIVELPISSSGHIIIPYVSAGVAGFYFNPMAELEGTSYDLQPLGTEGQFLPGNAYPEPYSRFQFSIPMSGGIKFVLNPFGSITLEMGVRKTFTDYIDDVSGTYPDLEVLADQDPIAARLSNRTNIEGIPVPRNPGAGRGGPKYKDWYGFSGISVAFNLVRDADGEEQKK